MKASMRTEVMLQANTTQSQTYANNDQFRLREAFIQVGNVLPESAGGGFLGGRTLRYRRQNIDINDFFVLDTSGYGGALREPEPEIRSSWPSRTWAAPKMI